VQSRLFKSGRDTGENGESTLKAVGGQSGKGITRVIALKGDADTTKYQNTMRRVFAVRVLRQTGKGAKVSFDQCREGNLQDKGVGARGQTNRGRRSNNSGRRKETARQRGR